MKTTIEWCDYTFNPWWGCTKVSPGCSNCYAEALDRRFCGSHWGPGVARKTFGDDHWKAPRQWNRIAANQKKRPRVFCASMADVFDDEGPAVERERLWCTIEKTPLLDWLILTKRPQSALRYLPRDWGAGWENVWIGTTVEDQKRADERIALLMGTPARVRFLSVEPLLEPVNLRLRDRRGLIDWVIVGGESGHGARQMDEAWVRSIRDECVAAGVRFFYKQKIDGRKKVSLPVLDGRRWAEFPCPAGAPA